MLNKVLLIGNLGGDPEVRYTQDGTPVCTLRLATNERYKNRNGEVQEHTEWHSIVLWGRLAENAKNYLRKGDRLYVEGRLRTREWQDKNGNARRTTEILVSAMRFLSTRGGNGNGQRAQARPQSHTPHAAPRNPEPAIPDDPFFDGGEDAPPEDVPF